MRKLSSIVGFIMILTAVVLLAAACGATPTPTPAPTPTPTVPPTLGRLTPDQLHAMLEKKDFFFVNVHIPFEGQLAQTDASIPYNQIEQNLSQFPADKHAKIVLYCKSGGMSDTAGNQLIKLGYTNVSHLEGGFIAWQKAGYPLLTTP